MIIKTRRKNKSILKRWFMRMTPLSRANPTAHVLPQEIFEGELVKEAFRSNRRRTDREFALVTFNFSDQQATDHRLAALLSGFRSRLRISDVVGWFDLRLAVLLPETKKSGALLVANQLATIAADHGIQVDTHVAIYPWDDQLVATTEALKHQAETSVKQSDNDRDDDGDDDDHQGGENYQRTDQAHNRFEPNGEFQNVEFQNGEFPKGDFNNGNSAMSVGVATQQLKSTQPAKRFSEISLRKALRGTGNPIQVLNDKTPRWKRTIDVVGSGVGLLMLSPVFAAAAVAIKTTSDGPIFFVQKREGKDGKAFGILKFRTMGINAEAEQAALREESEQDGPAFKLKNDPRITFVGKYLRKSCIDELPQLYNVLIGEMSLVGPRPLPVGESKQCTPWQRQRLSVLPGLTCIWQAHGGRDIKFSEWMRMDMEYIRKRSLFYDLRLICETAFIALLHRGSV
jgi:lipopolysaccharide/colanic/teichoic acid biosynthesis glycosyltransferase